MAIICEKREMILNFKEEKPKVYLIAPVPQQQVTYDKLLDEVASSCGVGRAQVKASVEGLLDRMGFFMDYGMSVRLGDFGIFKPMINVKAQTNPEDVGSGNVRRRKIKFTPGKRFKTMLNDLSILTKDDGKSSKLPGAVDPDDDGDYVDPTA